MRRIKGIISVLLVFATILCCGCTTKNNEQSSSSFQSSLGEESSSSEINSGDKTPKEEKTEMVNVQLSGNMVKVPELKEETISEIRIGETVLDFEQSGAEFTLSNCQNLTTGETEISFIGTTEYVFKACIATKIIMTVDDFTEMRSSLHTENDYYVLANDLDFTQVKYDGEAIFRGVFDGRGYALRNYIIKWTNQASGLFGSEASGTEEASTIIKNFAVVNMGGGGYGTGSIVDFLRENAVIENVYVQGAMDRGGYKTAVETGHNGYIAGRAEKNSVIKNCMIVDETEMLSANVYPEKIGLLIGAAVSSYPIMENCYAACIVERPMINAYYNYECEYEEYVNTSLNAYRKVSTMYSETLNKNTLPLLSKQGGNLYWGKTLISTI